MYACIYTTTGIHTTILYVPYNLFFQYVVTFYLSFIKLKMTRKRRGSRSCNYARHRKRQRYRVTDLEKGRTGGAAPPPLHDFFDESHRSILESDLASKNRARRSSSSPKSPPGVHSKASDGRTELSSDKKEENKASLIAAKKQIERLQKDAASEKKRPEKKDSSFLKDWVISIPSYFTDAQRRVYFI